VGGVFFAWALIKGLVGWREPTAGGDALRFAIALFFFAAGFLCRAEARIQERIILLLS